MKLTDEQKQIYAGKICPYCYDSTQYVDSSVIYGKSFGMVYYCQRCQAWVGVHAGTDKAKGRLANKELREWKMKAHAAFDPLWQNKIFKRRSKAYLWLSDQLGIPIQFTHIGMFSVDTCKRVVDIITESLTELKQKRMKVKSLMLHNFSNYARISVSFDPNVNYLIGPNGAGKTGLGLTGFHFMFQGIAEKSSGGNNPVIGERFRFIGDNAKSANGEMILYDEKTKVEIKVRRKLTKTGTEVSFEGPDNMKLSQQWLNELFNIFLIAPKKFIELSGKDQAKAIGIDVSTYESKLAILKQKFTEINRDLKNIGEIETVEKVEKVDITELLERKRKVQAKLQKEYDDNKEANGKLRKKWMEDCDLKREEISTFNKEQDKRQNRIDQMNRYRQRIIDICEEIHGIRDMVDLTKMDTFIHNLVKPQQKRIIADELPSEPEYIEELPDKSTLDAIDFELSQAAETNANVVKYEEYLKKIERRNNLQKELDDNKDEQYKVGQERLKYIQGYELPFDGLEINDDGDLILQGKPLREPYFSSGELLKIVPVLLSVQNPELKYVFIQDGSLMDEDSLKELEHHLTEKGFQLVIEIVGKSEIVGKNCILLKDNVIQQ